MADRLLEQVRVRPGRSIGELAWDIMGPGAYASRISFVCALLEGRGLIERRGEGGRKAPYTYHPAPRA